MTWKQVDADNAAVRWSSDALSGNKGPPAWSGAQVNDSLPTTQKTKSGGKEEENAVIRRTLSESGRCLSSRCMSLKAARLRRPCS